MAKHINMCLYPLTRALYALQLLLFSLYQAVFQTAILNDTLFLSLVNVVDYSIVVGLDEENHELVVGIIDYMRQYDIIKRVERMGKVSER